MDIEEWLRRLGLEQYAAAFHENAVDRDVLPKLTADDLRELGVVAIGHRRKLLAAIGDLGQPPTAATDGPTAVESRPPKAPEPSAERRYLTIMFCDLVGSTQIAAGLDAEEWRDLVGAYLDTASAAVTEMGGHVAKKLGDGLLALFGYPIAQENDAERAARAALAIQRGLSELNRKNAAAGKPLLTARIGLDAGPVVVDATGEIFGDTPNLAARVQAQAEPETILITARVLRHVAGLFVIEDRGAHELKGVPKPQPLFRLVRASGGGRRAGQRQLTPIVGRDEEMTLLMRRWERARQGEGQFVTIVGEPGLGKSRLTEELHSRLNETPHSWVEWSCSQLLQNTPLHPIAEWGRQRFGDLAPERRLADLEATLAQIKLDPAENVPLLAPLLDIPLPKERAPNFASEEVRRRQLAALTAWLLAGAKVQPIVLAVEDLHWADPTTLDLLRAAAERGAQAAIFVVATARPEFRPPWGMRSHHSVLSLAPLDGDQVRAMVAELSARHRLPSDVVEDVAARTGGVPLFVEELTRLLLERGAQGGHLIPPTLQQSLTARLDRLGPAREVAQIGSVIGRDFSYEMLHAIVEMDDLALQAALERLGEADILLVQGLPPQSDYRFNHALIQDAAYENLLKSRRQALHRRIAEALRDRFAATTEPEVLAHHFTQAGVTDEAIEWWGEAGDQALRRSAFQESIAHLGKAIEMADEAEGSGRAVSDDRLKLQNHYSRAVFWSKGYGTGEAEAAIEKIQKFGTESGSVDDRLAAYNGQWSNSWIRGETRTAFAAAESSLRLAEEDGNPSDVANSLRLLGMTWWTVGDFVKGQAHLDSAFNLARRQPDVICPNGTYLAPATASWLALITWHLGEIDRARILMDEAVTRLAALAHDPTSALTLTFKFWLDLRRGDAEAVQSGISSLLELAGSRDMVFYSTVGEMFDRWARAKLAPSQQSVAAFREALARYVAQGNKMSAPLYKGRLAELEANAGDWSTAENTVEEAIAMARAIEDHSGDVLLHRVRGDILLNLNPDHPAAAEEAFRTAVTIAENQKSRSFGLQAALSLAKVYQSTDRLAQAHGILAPALEGFSPTADFPEIEEAWALFAALKKNDEATADAARHQRRVKLATAYSQAVLWSKGFVAEETKSAVARAAELTTGTSDTADRFQTYYASWSRQFIRSELRAAHETAAAFLREAEMEKDSLASAVARRSLGAPMLYRGDLAAAKVQLELALVDLIAADVHQVLRYGTDARSNALGYLALTNWLLGDIDSSRIHIRQAVVDAGRSEHPPSIASARLFETLLEALRDDAVSALAAAEAMSAVVQKYRMPFYLEVNDILLTWARGRLFDPIPAAGGLREALATYLASGNRVCAPWFYGMLAELEFRTQNADAGLAAIEAGLAIAAETEAHFSDSYLYRLRGVISLKRSPSDPTSAEKAFQTAIDVAEQQKARSFGMQAALALAKLYQSTSRSAEAHVVLATALEGFSPTPELLEIEEGQALLASLAS